MIRECKLQRLFVIRDDLATDVTVQIDDERRLEIQR